MSRGPIHRIDPSRTGTLRRKLELEFMRRFDKLMRMINELVVSRDAFGIAVANSVDSGRGNNRGGIVAQNDRFTFATDSEKLNQFSQWLATQVSTEIITIGFGQPTDDAFWTQYIWQAYQKGMERAFDDLNKAKRFSGGVADFYAGTKQEFLQQSFGHPVSIERVKQLSSRVLTELEGVTAAMETQMKRELLDGLTQGLSPKQVARNINDRVEKIGKTRARAIAQTETMRAHSEGQLDSMERQGVDEIGIMVEWSTSGLGTTALGNPSPCKVCAPLEGIVLKVSEARGMLPRHVNCITGDSVVIADDVNSLMKSHFTGQIVKLITSAGRELSITPNHVLLTQFGFVPAKFIHEGIKIVQAPSFDTESVDAPNDQGNVTTISDVFAAFSESGAMTTISMPLAAEDIHGDGQFCNSEVNIIRPNGELRDEVVGALRKEFPLISFKRFDGKRSLSLISPANQLLKATAFASDSSMGLFRDFFAVLLGGLLHSHKAGLRSVTFSDTRILEAFVDYVPATLELLSQCQNTHPILKHLTDSVCRQIKGVLSSGAVRDLTSLEVDSAAFKAASDAILAYSHANSYFSGTDTRLIKFDDVISAETVHVVDLPVYDLETDSTVYRVNGLVTSNCRCVWTPANLGEPSVGVAKRVYDEKTGKVVIRKTRQKKTKEQIERQLAKSLEASGGKKKSRWQGADAKISKKRPKSPTGR